MIKTLLIDDEPLARSILREYLADYPQIEVVGECADGFEGVKAIARLQPELIFLDIQMPKINGFEMLEVIDQSPAVIFTTAFDEYAIKAFESHAVDYLLKPFSRDRFGKAMTKWLGQKPSTEKASTVAETIHQPEEKQRIVVKKGSNILIIPVNKIFYIEAYDDYVKIHTAEGFHLKKKTLTHYESALDPQEFVRVHRSYLIHLSELTRIEPLEKDTHIALLKNGSKIPLSQSGYSRLKEILGI